MEPQSTRSLLSQLADDLGWLEAHCRSQPDQAAQAGELRLAAAVVRNCIGPFLDGQPPTPLHIAVVGGAGAGKSTVANLLSGVAEAEANPQAGFTRHPVAFTSANGTLAWPAHLGFLGPLQRLEQLSPSNLDEDVYQVRRVPVDGGAFSLLPSFVVWDCPDMTTWAASGYVSRLLEVAGLADVIIYVASDERYNDEAPTQFLRLLLQAGKPVIVCLVKMKETDAPAIIAHFQRNVLSRLPRGTVACLPIPYLAPEQLANHTGDVARFRIPLLNQVAVLGEPASEARRRSTVAAMNYLASACERLLSVARQDLAALESWRAAVQSGRTEFEDRYRREYLTGEKFRRFDEALVRLMDLLELPGVGRVVSNALWVVRTPYRLVKSLVIKAFRRPDSATLPEQRVFDEALAGWLDHLRKEAVRRADSHPVWAYIDKGFKSGLADQARERFVQAYRSFQLSQANEIEGTARAIYEELEKSPAVLNTLRGGKFAIDAAAIAGSLTLPGPILQDAVIAVAATSLTQMLVELLGKGYVESQREQARFRQQALMAQHISGPLCEWLSQWPVSGGSAYERLQLTLRRIPVAVRQLQAAVSQALSVPAT